MAKNNIIIEITKIYQIIMKQMLQEIYLRMKIKAKINLLKKQI